jgi:hypothetical protein
LLFALLLGVLVEHGVFGPPQLFAQRSKLGLSPQDQQKYDDLVRSARQNELIAYIAAGAGLLFAVAAIPLMIYFDRKKKARKNALQADLQPKEETGSTHPGEVPGPPGQA